MSNSESENPVIPSPEPKPHRPRTNRDWWPNQLDLQVLHQHSPLSNPMGPDYNYADESHRFGQAGRLWKQAAPPYSEKWNQVMDELIKLDFTLDPTLTIYEASRDLMRARRAEWHDERRRG